MRTRRLAFLAVGCFRHCATVVATPSLNFPVNLQVPPVARVSQQFSFTFARSTFLGSEEVISYSLLTEPAWLQLNSDTRTLSGNATADDAGAKTFRLVATDSSGSAFSEVTLVVTGAVATADVATDPDSYRAAVTDLESDGTPRKEAILQVARRAGVPKREVYDAVHVDR